MILSVEALKNSDIVLNLWLMPFFSFHPHSQVKPAPTQLYRQLKQSQMQLMDYWLCLLLKCNPKQKKAYDNNKIYNK